jgi:hypothetical protein
MTQEEKFTALAKHLGWEPDPTTGLWYSVEGKPAGFRKETGAVHIMPQWFDDLNAIFEEEKQQGWHGPNKSGDYGCESQDHPGTAFSYVLYKICQDAGNGIISATAAQRADAFGQTLNIWPET